MAAPGAAHRRIRQRLSAPLPARAQAGEAAMLYQIAQSLLIA